MDPPVFQTPLQKTDAASKNDSVLDSSSSPTPVKLDDRQIEENMRKRRRLNTSDQASDGGTELTIKAYLCEEEMAYAAFPDTNALDGRRARSIKGGSTTVMQTMFDVWPQEAVDAILQEHGLTAVTISWRWRKSAKPDFDSNKWYLTTIVQVDSRVEPDFVWVIGGRKHLEIVAQKIHTRAQQELPDPDLEFLVEIECPDRFTNTYEYNIKVDNADIAKLEDAQDKIVEAARKWLPKIWVSVGVYTMDIPGTHPKKFVPTIAVTCRDEYATDFDAVLRDFRRVVRHNAIVNSLGESYPPQIRLLEGSIHLAAFPETERTLQTCIAPGQGSSMAPIKAKFSGTLGGFVKLVKGDEEKLAVLTAGHVGFSPKDDEEKHQYFKTGVSADASCRSPIQIVSPSPRDREIALEDLEKEKQRKVSALPLLEAKAADPTASAARLESSAKILQNARSELARVEAEIASLGVDTSDNMLGDTFATGPITIKRVGTGDKDCIRMDWALIELKGTRGTQAFGLNQAPVQHLRDHKSLLPFGADGDVDWVDHAPVETIGQPSPEIWVCLSGRSTPWVAGAINKIRRMYKWEDLGGAKSYEWDVGNDYGTGQPDEFGKGGDSGGWVLNAQRELVGLYIGGCKGRGCITSIKEVIDDIFETTGGWKMELPVL